MGTTYQCRSSAFVNGYIYAQIGQHNGMDTWIYKIDQEGNLIATYSYGDTLRYQYASGTNTVNPFQDDKLVSSTIYQRESDLVVFAILRVIDLDGNLIWQKKYGDSVHTHTLDQVIPTSDGGLIAIGSASFTQGFPVFFVLKTDAEGNEIWHKYLGEGLLFRNGVCVDELADQSGYIVSGFEDVTNYDPAGLIFILDHDGNVVNSRKYENWSSYDYQGVSSIQACSNGGYFFTTAYNTSQIDQFTYSNIPQIARIDDNLDVVWTCNLLPTSKGNRIQTVIETSDGDFVAVGSTYIRYPQITTAKYEGYISKVSENGALLWQRFYHHAEFGDNSLYDIDELPNGGFLCSGRAYNYAPFGDSVDTRSAWLLALDEMGCLVPGCDTLGIGITEQNPVQFSIYPNPADQFINIAFSTHEAMGDAVIRLYDMQGKLLKSVATTRPQATYMLDSAALESGIYFIKIEGKNAVATQKVMVVH